MKSEGTIQVKQARKEIPHTSEEEKEVPDPTIISPTGQPRAPPLRPPERFTNPWTTKKQRRQEQEQNHNKQ